MPDEWELIEEDASYETFELWENLHDLKENTTELLSKWFIDKIINETLEKEVKILFLKYDNLYKPELTESTEILQYWENEFFWWKKEAYEDVLELLDKYKL